MSFDPIRDYPLGRGDPTWSRRPAATGSTRSRSRRARGARSRGARSAPPRDAAAPGGDRARSGRAPLAENLERAAELARVPGRRAARDLHRAPPAPLDRRRARGLGRPARRLGRSRTAAFVREAAAAYVERGLLAVLSSSDRFGRASREGAAPRADHLADARARPGRGERAARSRARAGRRGWRRQRMDGRDAADFDVIDRFLVAHGLDLDVAAEAMALTDLELARKLVDIDVPRDELVRLARGLTPAKLARVVGAARPGRADVRAQEAARAQLPRQPGARHEPQGEPRAARRRRGRGGARAASPRSRRPSASRATRR